MKVSKKILIADDDDDVQDAVATILEYYEFHVAKVKTKEDIVAAVTSFRPGLILLDCSLSGFPARILCERLRGEELIKNIPIVLFSAAIDIKSLFKECGVCAYLEKPFELYALVSIVSQHCK